MADVKVGQEFAAVEHPLHRRHVLSVQVLYARDGCQGTTVPEPVGRACQVVVFSECFVEDHRRDDVTIGVPAARAITAERSDIHATTALLVEVVVERQRLVVVTQNSVGNASCEVARLGIGVVDVSLACVIGYGSLQGGTAKEHVLGFGTAPCIVAINGSQARTAIEHACHICDIGGVEAVEVKCRQCRAISEHITHVHHIGRVEAAEVKGRQTCAPTEHTSHIGHVGGIEAAKVNG